jgi:hypothetical protein
MPRIKLSVDKLVGYKRTELNERGICKLGTAKLGCAKFKLQPEGATTESLRVTSDDRR